MLKHFSDRDLTILAICLDEEGELNEKSSMNRSGKRKYGMEEHSGEIIFENEEHHLECSSAFSLAPSDHPKKKKKKIEKCCDCDMYSDKQFLKEASELFKSVRQNSLQSSNQDEFDRFGASVASQLRNLKSNYARSSAKLNIQKALFESEQMDLHISGSPTSSSTSASATNSKNTFPSFVTNPITNSNTIISNKPIVNDQNLTTMPIINKKLGPLMINPPSPSSTGSEFPQTQHFLICKKA